MPTFFSTKKSKAKVKDSTKPKQEILDEEVQKLDQETSELLALMQKPSPSSSAVHKRKRPLFGAAGHPAAFGHGFIATHLPKDQRHQARITIEVLDDLDDSDAKEQTEAQKQQDTLQQSLKRQQLVQDHQAAQETFDFAKEEHRVRQKVDDFFPSFKPERKQLNKQIDDLSTVQSTVSEIAKQQQLQQKYLALDQQDASLRERMELSAIKIQAQSRGFLCRRRRNHNVAVEQELADILAEETEGPTTLQPQTQSEDDSNNNNSSAGLTSFPAKESWHEVRDVENGSVWYYNTQTGESQWEPPPGFVPAESDNTPATPLLPLLQGSSTTAYATTSPDASSLLPELATANPYHPSVATTSARANTPTTSETSQLLPPLAPMSSRFDHHRASSPLGNLSARQQPSASLQLPALSPQRAQQQNQQQVINFSPPGVSWECDSVTGSESVCSGSTERTESNDDGKNLSTRGGSRLGLIPQDELHDLEAAAKEQEHHQWLLQQQQDSSDGWMDNDSLFMADGSRNSKLRDTIKMALKVSKFESVSSLIASNVVLRKKQLGAAGDSASRDNPSRSFARGSKREPVLGKKTNGVFVSVLANTSKPKHKSPHKLQSGADSLLGQPQQQQPRIRDIVDSGFYAESDNKANSKNQQQEGARSPDKSNHETAPPTSSSRTNTATPEERKTTICFNCWSSSQGTHCDVHRDPNEYRKIRGTQSILMCSNWEIDQLRRKYRAEEIQEIFMKQNASLRYDKKLRQYVSVVECRHPIYRCIDQLVESWNKTTRRKIHTRAWFRSFIEALRGGLIPKADPGTPSLMKLKNTIQNNKWCQRYADTVRDFQPVPPITQKNNTGQKQPIPDVVMVNPGHPQLHNWILITEYTKPVQLYLPRPYELPPRRCVPMPTPSYLDEVPLPVPNVFFDSGDKLSWFERLNARISTASINKALLQIKACSPPVGFSEVRRTKYPIPLTVMFATFARKATKGNMAVGGLSAELVIHLLVTTYVPAQFGSFIVLDRRAISPLPTKDHDACYICIIIDPTNLEYVLRELEHALNTRKPPCIVLAAKHFKHETEFEARARFPQNRPEQTGEDKRLGFRTFYLVELFEVSDWLATVSVTPNSDVLSPNSTSMNTTTTTKADRFYPFCIPSTRENTPVEFIHLLWIGQSSRNQPQLFTALGEQQPGEFMKNSNPNGEMGVCTSVVYRSWAYMQGSPYEEFSTDDGIAYWYDKRSGETFWTRPVLPIEKFRGKDGEIDGVVADGVGEKASCGVGVEQPRYSQQELRKYMIKSIEEPLDRERRITRVKASARKMDISIQLESNANTTPNPNAGKGLQRVAVPRLLFEQPDTEVDSTSRSSNGIPLSPVSTQSKSPIKNQMLNNFTDGSTMALQDTTKQLIATITQALGTALPILGGPGSAVTDMIQLGIGLGMGINMRATHQQHHVPHGIGSIDEDSSVLGSARSQNSAVGGDHEEDTGSISSLTSRSSASASTSVDISPTPDEAQLSGDVTPHPPTRMKGIEKNRGYVTHAPPGEGKNWIDKPVDSTSKSQTAVESFGGAVHKRVACLPKNFISAVTTTKTVKMQANYLPVIRNLNQPRSVGIVKPRSAFDEWASIQFSPWSAGRAVFGRQFMPNLMLRTEISSSANVGSSIVGSGAGAAEKPMEKHEHMTQAMKEAKQLETIISLCRHGKYEEIETMISQPDWTLPIDSKDVTGNTLLSIACQNNNKRIAKLCLRRGADINTQNLNGQSVLHYCHEYGFHDLMDYLINKGARDDLLNADGLTCYEGLSKEKVDAI